MYHVKVGEIRSRLKGLEEEFSKMFNKLNEGLENLEKEFAERGRLESLELVRELRRSAQELRKRLVEAKVELRSALRKARLEAELEERDELDEVREEVEEFFDKWSDLLEDYLGDLRDLAVSARRRLAVRPLQWRPHTPIIHVGRIVDESLRTAAKSLEATLRKLEEALRGWEEPAGPTYVVSSIRLPRRDLEIIDLLIEVGTFKSRSEAVAFFTHKGIEGTKPILEELLAKLRELKEARERLREEIRKALGGEKERSVEEE